MELLEESCKERPVLPLGPSIITSTSFVLLNALIHLFVLAVLVLFLTRNNPLFVIREHNFLFVISALLSSPIDCVIESIGLPASAMSGSVSGTEGTSIT
ncbi:ORF105 [White spot syndrome virus]|uniref:Wsv033 n=3 Tax=White spot syndrome virus TaxID=342409 RepID=Q8VBD2_WSSVS|nr:wsv033 [Shrimp white spot syndrome virus]AFX59410.1 wsv033 [White spot syndrome virus]AAL33037.1 wsv033 [Shrimp white spot syndrome virus]AAL88958.1 WSSV090 [Shrimp white spot syndrome virus]ATU83668.1 ORF105 [White spot syndrome virus]AWQ60223.1 wsv033 [Shrimp white spot syndrome virus]